MEALDKLKAHLNHKTVILGIGNTLRGDDGIGSLLAARLRGGIRCTVYDGGMSPENYLGKIVKDAPRDIVIVDAVDFGGAPAEIRVLDASEIRSTNLFFTHNASVSLVINYLKSNLQADIIVLLIQPKEVVFSDKLSPQLQEALAMLEKWFYEAAGKG